MYIILMINVIILPCPEELTLSPFLAGHFRLMHRNIPRMLIVSHVVKKVCLKEACGQVKNTAKPICQYH